MSLNRAAAGVNANLGHRDEHGMNLPGETEVEAEEEEEKEEISV
jgi:hypothetical protein